jgi:hypothetical protein
MGGTDSSKTSAPPLYLIKNEENYLISNMYCLPDIVKGTEKDIYTRRPARHGPASRHFTVEF